MTSNTYKLKIKDDYCSTVILVSGGYPEAYAKGKEIKGLEVAHNSIIFHAGTKYDGEKIVSNGGRVLAISSFGNTLQEALQTSYATADNLCFEDMFFRKDIGYEFL